MNEQRTALVEQAIAALEAEGLPWTNKNVYQRTGGSYHQLTSYLKARRRQGGPIAGPVTLQAQLREAYVVREHARHRLNTLTSRATGEILSEQEEAEQLRLERRLSNLEPVIARLEREVATEQQQADIRGLVETWGPLVSAKRTAYADFSRPLATSGRRLGHCSLSTSGRKWPSVPYRVPCKSASHFPSTASCHNA